ncbi:MAG: hypothetical protein MK132_04330 [Lentisphaerales bacterium]|nr:hypothetical protein [Lentisphaerales bacterium]
MNDKEEDLQDWINQVYYGNCCSHPDEEDEKICLDRSSEEKKENEKKSNSK